MTIYKNKHGEINFWGPYANELETHSDFIVNFSGGTDSALMMWMLVTELKNRNLDIKVHPSTLVDVDRPTNVWNAREILLYLKERFDINWGEEYISEYKKGSVNDIWDKSFYHGLHTAELRRQTGRAVLLHGRTANPPADIRNEFDLDTNREEVRDTPQEIWISRSMNSTYRPYIAVAKDWVAEVYKEHDLMEMFDLTASCISSNKETEFFTKPCKKCWWCKEKLWAFGCYDYSHM